MTRTTMPAADSRPVRPRLWYTDKSSNWGRPQAIGMAMASVLEAHHPYLDGPLTIPAEAFTLGGFREWALSAHMPEHVHPSFLNGWVYLEMSPEAADTHNRVKSIISARLLIIAEEEQLGMFYSDGMLLTNKRANLSTVPDALFFTFSTRRAGKVKLVRHRSTPDDDKEIVGSPDWVLEVVSSSSQRKDLDELPQRYHAAGIREYWLVDARGPRIDFRILVHGPDGYEPAERQGSWQASPVFGRRFKLQRRRNTDGFWSYALSMSR